MSNYDPAWYAKNKEARQAYVKQWYQENKERTRDRRLERARRNYDPEKERIKRAKKKDYFAAYREANKERAREKAKAWYAANKDRALAADRLRKFGVTKEQVEALVERQGGACAICKARLSELPRKHVHVDHCHATGQVRGVLCHYCNVVLGCVKDSPERLRSAAAYLEESTRAP